MTSESEYHISYDHPGAEATKKREKAHHLNMGTLLPSRLCPTCGKPLTIWCEEENVDLRAAERQVEYEVAEMARLGCAGCVS
jgi:hypothetical protein